MGLYRIRTGRRCVEGSPNGGPGRERPWCTTACALSRGRAYQVTFTDDTWGFAEAEIDIFDGDAVVVNSRNTSNARADQGFYLTVSC